MTSAPTIAFDYRPSRLIASCAAAGAACALLAVAMCGLPVALRGVLALAVLVLAFGGLRRFLHPPFRRIAWRSEGWLLVDGEGTEHAADLAWQRHIGPLVALDFRCPDRKRFRPLLAADNLDQDTRRRLILLLARADVMQPGGAI